MNKKLIAIILSAFAMFIWNAISWMALPFHGQQLQTLPDAIIQNISGQETKISSGIYHYPGLEDPDLIKKIEEGPRITFMVYRAEGGTFFDPLDFVKSLLFNVISASLLFFLLSHLADQQTTNVLMVAAIIGLLVCFMSDLPQTSWYQFPLLYAAINGIDYIIGLMIASMVIKKIALNN